MTQTKQREWYAQWKMFDDEETFLFKDWIYPHALSDFKDKAVLEAGCGGGQHAAMIAPYARQITAVDLNTVDIAKEKLISFHNITFIEADIATMNLREEFDIVFSIGVVHHTDSPDKTVTNLKRHLKRGGKLILWVYSKEGNFFVEHIIEPLRKIFLKRINRKQVLSISKFITVLLYGAVYTVYQLPLKFLPYYDYFGNFRKLSFRRNTLNVFDKLNAPQVEFISHSRVRQWFPENEFDDVHVSSYKGVSWRCSGTKK